jgi:hypothetical protein
MKQDINKILEEAFLRDFSNAKKQREAEEKQTKAIETVRKDVATITVCVN